MRTRQRIISFLLSLLFLIVVLPIKSHGQELLAASELNAQSAILIEASSGQVIFEKNADALMYPASTAKMLTVLLGIQNADDLDKTVVVTYTSTQIPEDASRLSLEAGQEIKYRDLLGGTLVGSGNDGANLIAELVSGDNQRFATLMTETAKGYGCTNTNFTNPSGLHDDLQVTTARDLAMIARVAMMDETFADFAKLSSYTIPRNNMNAGKRVSSRDRLFKVEQEAEQDKQYYYANATGIKTGYTSNAGYCYVASARRNGLDVIAVVLKCESYGKAFLDCKRLLDFGFSQFISTSILDLYLQNPRVVEVSRFASSDYDFGKLALNAVKVNNLADDKLVGLANNVDELIRLFKQTTTIQINHDALVAPIEAGQELGTMIYSPPNGGDKVEYKLIASRDIARRESAFLSVDEIRQIITNDPNPLPKLSLTFALILVVIFAPIIAIIVFIRRSIKKYNLRKKKQSQNFRNIHMR